VILGWSQPSNIGGDLDVSYTLYLNMNFETQYSRVLASGIKETQYEV
jgi:hypothetical protein